MKFRTILIDNDEATVRLISVVAREREHEILALDEPFSCPLYSDDACSCPQETACGDILIVSNHLPAISGLDLIERQLRRGCRGSVQNKAVMSRTWTPEDLARAEKIGCKVFKKPFLAREVIGWLEERELRIRAEAR
jgi:hypothetical protein